MQERIIVEQLGKQLKPRYSHLSLHQNLATLPAFKSELQEQFGYIPVLNEIDIILQRRTGELCAIEVKCIEARGGKLTRPFYDGIGQALSLLRYGFDHVALWHVFSGELDQRRLDRYGAAAWWFIRNQMQLPIEFSYLRADGNHETPAFVVMQYTGPNSSFDLIPIDWPNFDVTWKHPNPLLDTEEAQRLRKSLLSALTLEA